MPRERTTFHLPLPRRLIITRVNRILGNPFTASVIRMTTSSSRPPKYPVNAPSRIPAVPDTATTRLLTTTVVPSPCITLEKISRPKLSVPKKCRREGAWNFSAADMAVVL